jgi:hypothetical protein
MKLAARRLRLRQQLAPTGLGHQPPQQPLLVGVGRHQCPDQIHQQIGRMGPPPQRPWAAQLLPLPVVPPVPRRLGVVAARVQAKA